MVIELNQEAWRKLYIDKNVELKAIVNNDFRKDVFKLINKLALGKCKKAQRH